MGNVREVLFGEEGFMVDRENEEVLDLLVKFVEITLGKDIEFFLFHDFGEEPETYEAIRDLMEVCGEQRVEMELKFWSSIEIEVLTYQNLKCIEVYLYEPAQSASGNLFVKTKDIEEWKKILNNIKEA